MRRSITKIKKTNYYSWIRKEWDAGFYSEVQRFEAWQYNFTAITGKAIEDGIQAFDKGAAIYDWGPYHSWERGANENTNGLIRQYIPKGTDFSELTDEMLAEIEWKLNHRPRKSLGYRTPLEYCKQYLTLTKCVALLNWIHHLNLILKKNDKDCNFLLSISSNGWQ